MSTEQEIKAFGRDLELPTESARVTPSGDWPVLEGRDALEAGLFARVVTTPGMLVHRPGFGADAESFVERSARPDVRAEMATRLKLNIARDARISDVGVRVTEPVNGRTTVTLLVRTRGAQDVTPEKITFTLE